MTCGTWCRVHRPPRLQKAAVHVWRIGLDVPEPVLLRLEHHLAVDESDRARRFRFQRDRRRFIAARGSLREVLAHYVERPAGDIVFRYGPHGKPYLDGSPGIRFSVSHSADVAMLAVANGPEVGVDVEQIVEVDVDSLVGRFFSPREQLEFRRVSADLRRVAFFSGWTRKEAYIKGLGLGLAKPLASFDITLAPRPAALIADRDEPDAPRKWRLVDLPLDSGFLGALAVDTPGETVTLLERK